MFELGLQSVSIGGALGVAWWIVDKTLGERFRREARKDKTRRWMLERAAELRPGEVLMVPSNGACEIAMLDRSNAVPSHLVNPLEQPKQRKI